MAASGLRGVFDRVERAVGAPLEQAVASSHFGTAVTLWVGTTRAVDRAVRQRIDGGLATVLHLLNIPTRRDVQRLSRQLAAVNAEVRGLSLPLEHVVRYLAEQEGTAQLGPADRRTAEVGPAARALQTAETTPPAEDGPDA